MRGYDLVNAPAVLGKYRGCDFAAKVTGTTKILYLPNFYLFFFLLSTG